MRACGAFLKGMQGRSASAGVEALVQDLPRSSGVSVLTASGALEASFEDKTGDRPSCFTSAVIDGIVTGAADLDRDGRVTDDELYEYAYARVVAGTSPQRPRRLFAGEGRLVVTDAGSASRPTVRPALPPRSVATFASPANGAPVKHCSYFTGTSRLAEGETLILAARNLSNGKPDNYVEQVFGWQQPQNLGSWRGHQYFGGAAGQRYRIQVMAVDLDEVQAAYDGTHEDFNALADRGTVLASREVERIDGTVPGDCAGP
jgi:hypothetical protein